MVWQNNVLKCSIIKCLMQTKTLTNYILGPLIPNAMSSRSRLALACFSWQWLHICHLSTLQWRKPPSLATSTLSSTSTTSQISLYISGLTRSSATGCLENHKFNQIGVRKKKPDNAVLLGEGWFCLHIGKMFTIFQ